MTTALEMTARLSTTLHDLGAVRWVQAELWRAIDDALQALLEARPDLFDVTENVQLLGLGVQQSVPTDCYILFDIPYNLDENKAPISNITKIDRTVLDRSHRNWMIETASPRMQHWMQDERERKYFWAYPAIANDPATSAAPWVVMRYARRPTPVTSPSDVLAGTEEIINGVYYFSMNRLLEKDEKFAGSRQAEMFLNKFAMVVGARTEGESQEDQLSDDREGV